MRKSPGRKARRDKVAVAIQPVTSLDQIDQVLAIEEASFSNPWTREMYLAELENPGVSFCYLAYDAEGRSIGFCSFWRVLDELHINNLAVFPDRRREGVASALLTFVLNEGARQGAKRATLEVRQSNDPARCLVRTIRVYRGRCPARVLHPAGRRCPRAVARRSGYSCLNRGGPCVTFPTCRREADYGCTAARSESRAAEDRRGVS